VACGADARRGLRSGDAVNVEDSPSAVLQLKRVETPVVRRNGIGLAQGTPEVQGHGDWFALAVTGKRNNAKEGLMPRAQIKDEKTYSKLRGKGESKGKAARIANAAAGSSPGKVGRKGGKSGSYDDWSKQDLIQRAKEIGIKGRSTMSKADLVKALRDHCPGRRSPPAGGR
jgi:hypothetical protein